MKAVLKFIARTWDRAAIVATVGISLVGFGAARSVILDMEEQTAKVPALEAKVQTLDKIADSLDRVRLEQARQGAILDYIRRDLDQRSASAKGTP